MSRSLYNEFRELINRNSREHDSNSPDHILAEYLCSCLDAFEGATRERDRWYAIQPEPGHAFQHIAGNGHFEPLFTQDQVNEQIHEALEVEARADKPEPRDSTWEPHDNPPPPFGTRKP